VELLGSGEALHGGEETLRFRNRLFQRLVELHGYSAIAIESSFPRHVSLTSISPGAVQPHMRLFRTQDLAMDLAGSKLIENL
jgi:hypothetical protein